MAKISDFILIGVIGLGAYLVYKSGIFGAIQGISNLVQHGPGLSDPVPQELLDKWGFYWTTERKQQSRDFMGNIKDIGSNIEPYPTSTVKARTPRRIPARPQTPQWTRHKDKLWTIGISQKLKKDPTKSLYGTKYIHTSKQGTSIITRSGR